MFDNLFEAKRFIAQAASQASGSETKLSRTTLCTCAPAEYSATARTAQEAMHIINELRDNTGFQGYGSDKYKMGIDPVQLVDSASGSQFYRLDFVVQVNEDGDGGLKWIMGE